MNILFIMADQLRWDYLGCYGHPTLRTPNLDALAARGVRFTRAYAQSSVCGPSRMSFYTGRYMSGHGSSWNDVPLSASEWTMGDHLRPLGCRTLLLGKTHMRADAEGLARLGVAPGSPAWANAAECGFELINREEGIVLDPARLHPAASYNDWLKAQGYPGDNPWATHANGVEVDGEGVSGWYLDYNDRPARVAAEHSETAWLTDRAIEAIGELGAGPWCLHVSYIKPHWPYVAPAPWHALYGPDDVLPRRAAPDLSPHPVLRAFQELRVSHAFADEGVRRKVAAAYMGLVAELDHHLGRLFAWLEASGRATDTLIVFTSDHGDYLGDHWLGEKDFLHENAIRIPLIVADPRPGAARGRVSDALVEAIDLLPTFAEALGGNPVHPRLDGRSLMPHLRGEAPAGWRDAAICEYDYSVLRVRRTLGRHPDASGMRAVVGERHKLLHFDGFPPMLFDLADDPHELVDLAASPAHAGVRAALEARLLAFALRSRRVTESAAAIERRTDTQVTRGILLGIRNAEDHARALAAEQAR